MNNLKILFPFVLGAILLTGFAIPVFAINYIPGVTVGQYVKYGNFVGVGPGFESFNDYDHLTLQVTSVSGASVSLLSTGQFKNGDPIPGNGTVMVWDVSAGTQDGIASAQGPIIAANLNQGDAIPPPNTYTVNKTENRVYLGISRSVNILDLTLSTPEYNTTIVYVYDRASGMLLESTSQTITQGQTEPVTSTYSYTVIETNLFESATTSPSPTIPEIPNSLVFVLVAVLSAFAVVVAKKKLIKPFGSS